MADTAAGIYHKLAKVMAGVERIAKNGRNDFHKYAYVTDADTAEMVRTQLVEHDVVFVPTMLGCEHNGEFTTVHMQFRFVDPDDGTAVTCDWFGDGHDKLDKGVYKAQTGCTKTFLLKFFLVPTGDDPEDDNKHQSDKPTVRPASPARPQAPARTVDATTGEARKPAPAVPDNPLTEALQDKLGGDVQPTGDAPTLSDDAKALLRDIAIALGQRGITMKDDHQDAWHSYLKVKYGVDSQKSLTLDQMRECAKLAKGTKAALHKALTDAGVQVA